ncbi:MAG: hypothetical protein HY259_13535 [Chloroflexi bacterium]|nr:hypothetical protein [Chloroflexota bacterium]MBI3734457.1 hypothetical protein [Chloroflexota bacterium]
MPLALCYNPLEAMPKRFSSTEFFRALPAAVRPLLPKGLRPFEHRARSWMLQVYYDSAEVHYEASKLYRPSVFEVGLHFERRGQERNDALLRHFAPYVFEIKAELGEQVKFEPWDKGWSKIYETLAVAPYNEDYLAQVAGRLAQMIAVLQPMLEEYDDRREQRPKEAAR